MVEKEDVQNFLEQFHAKMNVFGIIYRDDRGKNRKTLEELGLCLRTDGLLLKVLLRMIM